MTARPASELIQRALAHERAGQHEQAAELYQAVIATEPTNALALHQLSGLTAAAGDLAGAIRLMTRALDADPQMAQGYSNLANFLRDEGRLDEAMAAHRTAVRLAPGFADAYRCLLCTLLYLPDVDPERRFAEHVGFARYRPPPDQVLPPPVGFNRDPERRLRIGLLSSDLRMHGVARNLAPLFDRRDRAAFELICYAEVAVPDGFTAMAQRLSDAWRSTVGLPDRTIAEMIRRDAVDILIVSAGRFDRNRPLIACYRPAPIQMSMCDAATSGLAEIDYVLTDPVLSPPGSTERFVERLVHVPAIFNFPKLPPLPITAPPARARGAVAFGSFNNPSKLNRATIALWADALRAVPGATLTLKYHTRFADPDLCARVRGAFSAAGIDPARLIFVATRDDFTAQLAAYGGIDIALDPTPFTGANTTFEALWMGIPVVTLAGDTMLSRSGATVLAAAGLDEMIATSPEDFAARAAALAGDLPRLERLRATLRDRVLGSRLCDAVGFARSIESAWRTMWRDWCRQTG